jgi:hypothetical protein
MSPRADGPGMRAHVAADEIMVRQRPLAPPREVSPADPPDSRGGLVGSATRPGGHQRRAPPREASDAREARGLEDLRRRRHRQTGGKAVGR